MFDLNAYKAFLQEHIASARQMASNRDLSALYSTSVTAFACGNFWGDNLAQVPFCAYDPRGNKLPVESGHALARMVAAPEFSNLLRKIAITDLFWGRVLLAKQYNLYNGLMGLQWVNPLLYRVDALVNYGVRGFYLYPGRYHLQHTGYLKSKDAVYFHGHDFEDDTDGVSAAEVAFLEASTEPEIALTALSFFRNLAIPAALVSPDGEPKLQHEKDLPKLLAFIRNRFQGAVNAGRTFASASAWKWTAMQLPFKDLVMRDIKLDMRESVAIAFNVSVEFLTTGQTTYAELEGKIALWKQMRLAPRAMWVADRLSEGIQGDFPGYSLRAEPVQEQDETALLDMVERKKNNALMSLYDAQVAVGNAQPVEAWRDLYIIDGLPIPQADVRNYWRYKLLVAPSVYNVSEVTGEPLPQPVDPGQVIPTETPGGNVIADTITPSALPAATPAAAAAETAPLYATLAIGAHPDLIGLQNRLKALFALQSVKWSAPDEFHVTLLYAPQATAEQATALKMALATYDLAPLTLGVGSLRSFDNLGEHALHFRVKRNEGLLTLQEEVAGLAQEAGVALSAYSQPDDYIPHITMGYAMDKLPAITFQSKLTVEPLSLQVVHGDTLLLERFFEDRTAPEPIAADDHLPDAVFKEIKVASRKGATFVAAALDAHTTRYIQALVEQSIPQEMIITAAKGFYRQVRAAKAIQATRLDFETEFEGVFASARAKQIDRRRAGTILRDVLRRYATQAFQDGLTDGGVDANEIDAEDRAALKTYLSEQSGFVSGLTEVLFKGDGVSDAQANNKPSQWFNGSIYPAYLLGLNSAAGNMMMEWVLGNTEEHCNSCLSLNGQRHRLKAFMAQAFYPKSDKLVCGAGKLCDCMFVPTNGRARGSLKSVPVAHKSHQEQVA